MANKDPEAHHAYDRAYHEAHREERCAYNRAYYAAHRENIAVRDRAYRKTHREEIAARKRTYQEAHQEEIAVYLHAWYEAHQEERCAHVRAYYAAHREERTATSRHWRNTHREERHAYRETHLLESAECERRRRALKRNATIGPIDLEAIKVRDRMHCCICGKRVNEKLKHPHPNSLSFDHSHPLSLHGPHSQENQRVAHLICNQRRGMGRLPVQMVLC